MIKNVKIFALFLCSLWTGFACGSQPASLPPELSVVDTTSTDFTNNMLMGSVQPAENKPAQNIVKKTVPEKNVVKGISDKGSKKTNVLYQPAAMDDEEIFLNFEDVDLASVASYMENIHNVTFVTDDAVTSTATATSTSSSSTSSGLQGHKVSFRMFKSVTKRQSWNLFVTFLKMAGLDLVPMAQPGFYKIVSFATALNEAIPTYIGVDPALLPENDMMVRYVYFLQNSEPATIQSLVTQLQGSTGKLETYTDLKALVFIDKAYNIQSLMKIVTEMDRSVAPQVVSVIKLERALAADVITLYNSLKPVETTSERAWAPVKKESSLQYFPSDVILTADARTNSLILLGTEDAVSRVENFVKNHVDEEIVYRDAPVHVYHLEYTNSTDIKTILSSVIQYGSGTTSASYGGTLDGEKYFSPMTIVADAKTNSLIINSTKSDYEALEKLIKELDVPQKQVAFDFLLLQVTDVDARTLGAQIAGPVDSGGSPVESTFLNSVTAQTSGVPDGTSVVAGGSGNLKASLASLITGSSSLVNTAGSTIVTFGQTIWGLLKIVKSIGTTQIISNPFLVTTNNTPGNMQMGVTRRVKTSDVYTSSSTSVASGYESLTASLNITVTPQVNDNNIINLDLSIISDDFTVASASDVNSANTNNKTITTSATLAAGEVLVIGGIVKENISSAGSGVPILENIPVLGWLFKSRTRTITKDHFVVFIAPRIVDPLSDGDLADSYTQQKIEQAHSYLDLMNDLEMSSIQRDPISTSFFSVDRPTEIALFQEDSNAYKEAQAERDALMSRVREKAEEQKSSRKSRRERRAAKRKASQNLREEQKKKKRKKRRRRKNKFSKGKIVIAQGEESSSDIVKNMMSESFTGTVAEGMSDEEEVQFIKGAFPLTAKHLEVTSIYDSINSGQGGEKNA